MGWGRVRSRKVFVTADDFSVRGGHADGGIQGKAAYGEVRAHEPPETSNQPRLSQNLARRARVPIVFTISYCSLQFMNNIRLDPPPRRFQRRRQRSNLCVLPSKLRFLST